MQAVSNPARQRERYADADSSRYEIMPSKARHLRQIAHRRLAAVRLPVGIRGKARRGIEREVRGHRSKILRIQRQDMLQAFDAVGHQQCDRAEHEHRQSILLPVLVLLRINAAKLVEQPLNRSEEARQRLLVPLEYTIHVAAERLGYRENYRRKEQNLNPSICCHNFSIFARLTKLQRPFRKGANLFPRTLCI